MTESSVGISFAAVQQCGDESWGSAHQKAERAKAGPVICEILRYLVAHPDAKDSCDGVCKWWLPNDLANRQKRKVQDALDTLVFRGWVTERKSRSAKGIYGLNKERLQEIERFLRQSGNRN